MQGHFDTRTLLCNVVLVQIILLYIHISSRYIEVDKTSWAYSIIKFCSYKPVHSVVNNGHKFKLKVSVAKTKPGINLILNLGVAIFLLLLYG